MDFRLTGATLFNESRSELLANEEIMIHRATVLSLIQFPVCFILCVALNNVTYNER
jgi:hypothetical protein